MEERPSDATVWGDIVRVTPRFETAQQLNSEQSTFGRELKGNIRGEAQKRLRIVTTKEALIQLVQEEQSKAERLEKQELGTVVSQAALVSSKRQHGQWNDTAVIQSVLTTFSSFLGSFSNIVEVIRQADLQYGGLAYSTLAAFLIIVVEKSPREQYIRDALVDFSRDLAKLSKIALMPPKKTLAVSLVRIYSNIVNFAQRATLYYQLSGMSKKIYAMRHSPKTNLDSLRQEISRDSDDMFREISAIHANLVDERNQQAAEVKSVVLSVKSTTAEEVEQLRLNRVVVSELKPYFGKVHVEPDEMSRYRAALDSAARMGKQYTRFDFSELSANEQYKSWKSEETSGILLLKGKTADPRTGFSWLSTAALDCISVAKTERKYATSFCLVETAEFPQPESKPQPQLVISKVIWQLLNQKPDLVEDPTRQPKIRERLENDMWKDNCPVLPCDLLIELLADVPKAYIIIDRIDRCDHFSINFVNQLLRIVKESTSVVKIFVVISDNSAHGFDTKNLDTAGVEDKCHIVTLNQAPKASKDAATGGSGNRLMSRSRSVRW